MISLRPRAVKHLNHLHTGEDEMQMINVCNDAYALQLRAERRNATRQTTRAKRVAVRKSRRANRSGAR